MVDLSKNATLPLMLCLALVLFGQVYSSQPEKFCGPKLTNTLTKLCDLFPGMSKRAKGFKMEPNDFAIAPKDWPMLHSEMDQIVTTGKMKYEPDWIKYFPSILRRTGDVDAGENDVEVFGQDSFQLRKRQHGVVYECCVKPCTMNYLLTNYCSSY